MADGIKEIIDSLERQRTAIENALSALRGIEVAGQQSASTSTSRRGPAKRKGGMTPEGRKRLAEAMRRRWAAKRTSSQARKASKRAGKKAAA